MVEVRLTDGAIVHVDGGTYHTQAESRLLIVEVKDHNVIFNFSHVAYVAMVENIVKEDEDD